MNDLKPGKLKIRFPGEKICSHLVALLVKFISIISYKQMSFELKSNLEKTNFISALYKLTIMTKSYVQFLNMKSTKEMAVLNLCTDYDSEHALFLHCIIGKFLNVQSTGSSRTVYSNFVSDTLNLLKILTNWFQSINIR